MAKFKLTDNCFNGDLSTITEAVHQLCAETGIDFQTNLSQIEFGFNLPVCERVSKYLLPMRYAEGYKGRFFHAGGQATFLQKEIVMRFYDKTKDFKSTKLGLRLSENRRVNLLRYEICIRYPKRVLKLTRRATLADLCSEKFYCNLVNVWSEQFKRIQFDTISRQNFPLNMVGDIKKHLIRKGIDSYGGLTDMLMLADTIEFQNNISVNRNRLKSLVLNICLDASFNCQDDLIEELRGKILFTALNHGLR